MKVFVHKPKAIISAAMTLFFGGYGIFFLTRRDWIPSMVFLLAAGLFGWVLFRNARLIRISPEGIHQSFFGLSGNAMTWDQVQEMGLIGEEVFHRKGKSGDKYIYFSPRKMTADERFQMIVKWPPRKSVIYMAYSEKALEYCMSLWQGELMTYNVTDLFPNTGEPRGARK